MRELHMKMSMSVDGFVGGPKGEIDWIFSTGDDQSRRWVLGVVGNASLHIMGSKTYRDMRSWWPYSKEPFAEPMNAVPKAIFTQHGAASLRQGATTQAVTDAAAALKRQGGARVEADPEILKGWTDPYIAEGPMAEEVAKLKRGEGKPILAHGGAGFMRSLIATGEIDQFNLVVHPVVLGKGLPIFSGLAKVQPLKLVSSTAFPGGVTAQVYRRA